MNRGSSKTTDSSNLPTPSQSVSCSTSMAPKSADSTQTHPQKNTSAPSVFRDPITPSPGSAVPLLLDSTELIFNSPLPPPAPSSSSSSHPHILLKIATPYDADSFDDFLNQYPDLRTKYPNLAFKLRNGFSMGEFPELEDTVIWLNSPTVEERLDFIEEYLREEVEVGRMDRPFSRMQVEVILGSPFQCSPISIDVSIKADGSEKLRLCTNLSKRSREHPATNDFIDTSKYPTKFDTAAMVADIVSPIYLVFSLFFPLPPRLQSRTVKHDKITTQNRLNNEHVPNG